MAKGIPKTMKKVKAATTTAQGPVKMAAAQADFVGADVAALKVELNAFLGKLRAAGIVAPNA